MIAITLFTFLSLTSTDAKSFSGRITMDGSSTVFPISEAAAEEFQKKYPQVRTAVAMSGTGGGFKKFCKGETDLTGASRPIEETEKKLCLENKIDFIELPVAYDGITIVVNPDNNWLTNLTTQELKKIWEADSQVKKWSDIRAGFPNETIRLFGPGHDSGTFDYFTAVINGKEKSSRKDFTASEDDNMLVKGVSGEKYSLGYFGYAYFKSNTKRLKAVAVNNGKDFVSPTVESISSGAYRPLSRPLFVYISQKSLAKPEILEFANFYLHTAKHLAEEVGYIPLPNNILAMAEKRLENKISGSIFSDESSRKMALDKLLSRSGR